MRLLIRAITERRVLNLPMPMRVVSRAFPLWATKFPRDFLHLVGTMPMQPEPEVLGGVDQYDVMLPRVLVRGSRWRCPRTLWLADLERYSIQTRTSDDISLSMHVPTRAPEPPADETAAPADLSADERSTIREGFSCVAIGGVQAVRSPFEGFAGLIAEDERGNLVSMLQLVVHAVRITQDYQVFATLPLQVHLCLVA